MKLLSICREPYVTGCKGLRQGAVRESNWVQGFEPPEYLYPILLVALRTGLRYGNIMGLRWDHVDWDSRILRLPASETKSKRDWSLPISADVLKVLRELFKKNKETDEPSVEVFGGIREVRTSFKKALERAGLPRIRFHDLRHSYASLAIAAGTDPKALQRAMGHGSIRITLDVYAHLLPCSYDGAVERMEALLAG